MYKGDAFLELTGGWPSLQQESLPENEDDAGERKGQREIEVRSEADGDSETGSRCRNTGVPGLSDQSSLILLKLASICSSHLLSQGLITTPYFPHFIQVNCLVVYLPPSRLTFHESKAVLPPTVMCC